jgi:hypothetical protein
MTSIHTVRT